MKTKKSMLGLIGLFFVAVVTTIAYQIPLPAVEAASSTANINVSATVVPISDDIKITNPVDGSTVTSDTGNIVVTYQNIVSGTVYLYNPATGSLIFSAPVTVDASGTATIPYTLPDYGQYVVQFYAETTVGAEISAQPVTFTYNSLSNCPDGNCGECAQEDCTGLPKEDPKNPVITICYDENVVSLTLIVRNSAGKIIHTEDVPITEEDRAKGDCKDIEVHLNRSVFECLPNDTYAVEVIAKDRSGNKLGESLFLAISYVCEEDIDVPKTGIISFGSLNLSRGDLVVFGVGAAALIVLAFAYFKRKKAAQN
jgi:hypothetical protein